jgi:hypothetical protein
MTASAKRDVPMRMPRGIASTQDIANATKMRMALIERSCTRSPSAASCTSRWITRSGEGRKSGLTKPASEITHHTKPIATNAQAPIAA